MGNYKPKTANQFRWKDSKKIQKFIQGQIIVNDVNFEVTPGQDLNVYNFNTVPEAKTIAETVKYCYENDIPLIIYDTKGGIWVSTAFASDTECYISRTINNEIMNAFIDIYDNYIEINPVREEMLSSDNVKTLFKQNITGTGNITMYRHQIIIRFDIDSKEVHYVVYSPNKAQIFDYDTFISVANPISNFNYTAVYENGNNAEPAFIRFASGTIIVGLSTGMETFTGLADVVSEL